MEAAALIVSIGGFVATAAAAAFAWVQANHAGTAQKEAKTAAASAEELTVAANRIAAEAREALSASAAALAEANELTRAQMPRYPWIVRQSGSTIEVRNNSGDILRHVTFHPGINSSNDFTPMNAFPVDEMHPNEALVFAYEKTFDSDPTSTLMLRWQLDDNAKIYEWRHTVH